jgi:hypothetical protein
MSTLAIAGAVNGAAAKATLVTSGANLVTIPFANNGVAGTQAFNTDGINDVAVSSRVDFAGGTTLGRDHFPWEVPNGPSAGVYPDNYYPLILSLDDALKWTWLVKKWQFSGQIEFDITRNSDSSTGHFVATYDFTISQYGGAGDTELIVENQTVVLHGAVTFGIDSSSITNGFPGTPDPIFFENGMGILDVTYPSIVWKGADQLRPEIDHTSIIEGNPDPSPSGNFFFIQLSTVKNKAGSDGSPISNGFLIDGHAINLYYWLDTDSCSFSNITSTLSLAPLEYWPYANSNGDPVYNTSTGAQLVDPFS